MSSRRQRRNREPNAPDADALMAAVSKNYATASISPEARLQRIAAFQESNQFRTYALIVTRQFLKSHKLQELDTIFDRPEKIDLSLGNRWVSNTAALTRNAVRAELTEFMVHNVHPELGAGELADEVWAILNPAYTALMQRRHAEAEKQQLLTNSAVANLPPGGVIIGPGGIAGGPVYGPQPQPQKKP